MSYNFFLLFMAPRPPILTVSVYVLRFALLAFFFSLVLVLLPLIYPYYTAVEDLPLFSVSRGDLLFYTSGYQEGDLILYQTPRYDAVSVLYLNNTSQEPVYKNLTYVPHLGTFLSFIANEPGSALVNTTFVEVDTTYGTYFSLPYLSRDIIETRNIYGSVFLLLPSWEYYLAVFFLAFLLYLAAIFSFRRIWRSRTSVGPYHKL